MRPFFEALRIWQPVAAKSACELLSVAVPNRTGTMKSRDTTPKNQKPSFRRVFEMEGVFGAGALPPQFLAELTDTLNSRICNYNPTSARLWQA